MCHVLLYWISRLGSLKKRSLFENDKDFAFLELKAKCESKHG